MELLLALKDEHFCPVHLLSALLRAPQLQALKLRLQYPDLQKHYLDHVHSDNILVVSREPLTTGSAGYSPWGRKELDTTEQLSMLTHKESFFLVIQYRSLIWQLSGSSQLLWPNKWKLQKYFVTDFSKRKMWMFHPLENIIIPPLQRSTHLTQLQHTLNFQIILGHHKSVVNFMDKVKTLRSH